jgi:hypothetical protein
MKKSAKLFPEPGIDTVCTWASDKYAEGVG